MKKGWKNLLTGIAMAAAGFAVYLMWEDYTRKAEFAQRAAEKRAEFIERRKAHARRKAAMKAAEAATAQSPLNCPKSQAFAVEQEEPLPHTSGICMEDTPEAVDSAHGTDIQ